VGRESAWASAHVDGVVRALTERFAGGRLGIELDPRVDGDRIRIAFRSTDVVAAFERWFADLEAGERKRRARSGSSEEPAQPR
jgi:hypothetical protein